MADETSINQRIKLLIDELSNGNVLAFARSISKTSGMISDYIGGRLNKPSFDVLQQILLTYPRINPEWLMTGVGPMERPEAGGVAVLSDERAFYTRQDAIQLVTVDNSGKENIALVETRAQAGYARGGFLEREYLSDLPTFTLPGQRFRNGTFRAFQVAGDSMETNLFAGDIVIARRLQSWPTEIKNGGIHVIVTLDEVLVKRVLNQLDRSGSLALESDNSSYPVRPLEGAEVREVWVMVAAVCFQFPAPATNLDLARKLDATNTEVAALRIRLERLTQLQPQA